VQTSASKPSVSYEYEDDTGLIDATRKAESFCQYGTWPTAMDFDKRSGDHHVTFVCDQPRVVAAPTTVLSRRQPCGPTRIATTGAWSMRSVRRSATVWE
jgi:hypothetical protein